MKSLRDKGYIISAVATTDEYVSYIKSEGFSFIPVTISRKGKNPLEDISLVFRFWQILKREQPNIILTYTPKPNIYASIAAHFLHVRVISNVAGLGNVFVNSGILSVIVSCLYKLAFKQSYRIYFQNNDDLKYFTDKGLVDKSVSVRIPGSGVDIRKFTPQPHRNTDNKFIFMLVSRMLWDKGIGEFVQAARRLKIKYPNVAFYLIGFIDSQNPQGISKQQIESWVKEKIIDYYGATYDIVGTMANADCIVLPSFYREGVPRVLLEAASMAKPIITTDSVGCRDAVEDGITGYLCKAKDVDDLYDKMSRILHLSKEEREAMGMRGRAKMSREFDENFVIQRYMNDIERLESS